MSLSTADIYDALAPHYREYSNNKTEYLKGVETFILNYIPNGSESLLDVGAGDGVRGMALAREKGMSQTVLCDISPEMVAQCKKLNPTDVWQSAAEELPDSPLGFDVILSLWNVLGHVENRSKRVQALTKMKKLLSEKGLIFFDVNNRHNASAYGWFKVMGRRIIDFIYPSEKRGDAEFNWKIGDQVFPAMGHLFTPSEIEAIIHESGLEIIKRVSVNYTDGKSHKSPYKGQLVYMLESLS